MKNKIIITLLLSTLTILGYGQIININFINRVYLDVKSGVNADTILSLLQREMTTENSASNDSLKINYLLGTSLNMGNQHLSVILEAYFGNNRVYECKEDNLYDTTILGSNVFDVSKAKWKDYDEKIYAALEEIRSFYREKPELYVKYFYSYPIYVIWDIKSSLNRYHQINCHQTSTLKLLYTFFQEAGKKEASYYYSELSDMCLDLLRFSNSKDIQGYLFGKYLRSEVFYYKNIISLKSKDFGKISYSIIIRK